MKRILGRLSISLLAAGLLAAPAQAQSETIDGVWRSPDDADGSYLTVQVSPCDDTAEERCGTVTSANEGANPETVGHEVVRGMEQGEDGVWRGEILQPLEGDVYDSRIRLVSRDVLRVDGCILGGLLCETQRWTRVAPDRAGERG